MQFTEVPHFVGELHHILHSGDRYIELIPVRHIKSIGKQKDSVKEALPMYFDPAAFHGHYDPVIAHHKEL